mmetsp:Transcript_43317/g.58845  ORF Transcript_43317/g.58845 Transcript_43317/m.58845 type:complete len:346 (-) Transcript_43317:754-1791(-)
MACPLSQDLTAASMKLHPDAKLNLLQRQVLDQLFHRMSPDAAVVVTNPLVAGNPIVWVSGPWENVCEISYDKAVGRQVGRMMQGAQTDATSVAKMKEAFLCKSPFKAQVLNYKGDTRKPFWNMLSVTPLLHRGELQLCVANVQDYSHHVRQLDRLAPSQFCKVAHSFQRGVRLTPCSSNSACAATAPYAAERPRSPPVIGCGTYLCLSKPSVLEADDSWPLLQPPMETKQVPHMRRLGWGNLHLEPEHLLERLCNALLAVDAQVAAGCEAKSDVQSVRATKAGTQFIMSVQEQADGSFSITCARIAGDTFQFHQVFRQIKAVLGDSLTAHCLSKDHKMRAVACRG